MGAVWAEPVADRGVERHGFTVECECPVGGTEWGEDLVAASAWAQVCDCCVAEADVAATGVETSRHLGHERVLEPGCSHGLSSLVTVLPSMS